MNLIYALENLKNYNVFDWLKHDDRMKISQFFLSVVKPEPSWKFRYLICKIWALSLDNF